MEKGDIKEIVFIGAGNLATQLALELQKSGLLIKQIYSRTDKSACQLANLLNVAYTSNIKNIVSADLYIFAVSDSVIKTLSEQINCEKAIFVHTAGSVDMSVFSAKREYGVFYPLQTFSKQRHLDFSSIPICIEAGSKNVEERLISLAKKISSKVELISSSQRKQIHLAAVFVCNFTNHMYTIGANLLESNNMSFELLKPLIYETASKIKELSPKDAQTGPAMRSDEKTINKHQDMLYDKVCLQKIYRFVSESISLEHKQ